MTARRTPAHLVAGLLALTALLCGNASASSGAPGGAPVAPRAVDAATAAGTVTVTWTHPAGSDSPALSGFEIRCVSTDGGRTLTATESAGARSAVLSGLPADRTYRCAVTASGPGGSSASRRSPFVMHATTTTTRRSTEMHVPGAADQRIAARVRSSSVESCAHRVLVRAPDGSVLRQACPLGSTPVFLEAAPVSGAGTATVTFSSDRGAPGTAELSAFVFRDGAGTIEVDGPAVTTYIPSSGQVNRLSFPGTAGQQVAGTIIDNTISFSGVALVSPSGSVLSSASGERGFLDTATLPETGTYTVLVDPKNAFTGRVTIDLYTVPTNSGRIRVDGPAQLVELSVRGQNATRTFSGSAGQRVIVVGEQSTVSGGRLLLRTGDGTAIGEGILLSGRSSVGPVTLPRTGSYDLVVDPDEERTGQLRLAVSTVPPDPGGTIPIGTRTLVEVSSPGQKAVRTFSGTAGQRLTAQISGSTFTSASTTAGDLFLSQPDGNYLAGTQLYGPGAYLDAFTLPVTGTYRLTVDPYEQGTGQLYVLLRDVPANTGTIRLDGPAVVVDVAIPGQDPVRTFSLSAATVVTLDVTDASFVGGNVSLQTEDGVPFGGYAYLDGFDTAIEDVRLPPGDFQVLVDAFETRTGTVTLRLRR